MLLARIILLLILFLLLSQMQLYIAVMCLTLCFWVGWLFGANGAI